MLPMGIAFSAGSWASIKPDILTSFTAGGNHLITVVELDLLGFGGHVIVFHFSFLQLCYLLSESLNFSKPSATILLPMAQIAGLA